MAYLQGVAGNRAVRRFVDAPDGKQPVTPQAGPDSIQRLGEFTDDPTELQNRANKVFGVFTAAHAEAVTRAIQWTALAEKYGLAYKQAYDTHEAVRAKQAKSDKLKADICMFVLGLATSGLMGAATTLIKANEVVKAIDAWKVAAITPVVTGSIKKGIDLAATPAGTVANISQDPLLFYLELKNAVSEQANLSVSTMNEYVQWAQQIQLDTDRQAVWMAEADPQEFKADVEEWKAQQPLFTKPGSFNADDLKKELEIGLWAQWVQQLHQVKKMYTCGGAIEYDDYTGPGGVVEKHLDELIPDVTKNISWGYFWTSDSQIKKLIDWGKGWKPSQTFKVG